MHGTHPYIKDSFRPSIWIYPFLLLVKRVLPANIGRTLAETSPPSSTAVIRPTSLQIRWPFLKIHQPLHPTLPKAACATSAMRGTTMARAAGLTSNFSAVSNKSDLRDPVNAAESGSENGSEEPITPSAQAGLQKVEAMAQVWTRNELIVAYSRCADSQ